MNLKEFIVTSVFVICIAFVFLAALQHGFDKMTAEECRQGIKEACNAVKY